MPAQQLRLVVGDLPAVGRRVRGAAGKLRKLCHVCAARWTRDVFLQTYKEVKDFPLLRLTAEGFEEVT